MVLVATAVALLVTTTTESRLLCLDEQRLSAQNPLVGFNFTLYLFFSRLKTELDILCTKVDIFILDIKFCDPKSILQIWTSHNIKFFVYNITIYSPLHMTLYQGRNSCVLQSPTVDCKTLLVLPVGRKNQFRHHPNK